MVLSPATCATTVPQYDPPYQGSSGEHTDNALDTSPCRFCTDWALAKKYHLRSCTHDHCVISALYLLLIITFPPLFEELDIFLLLPVPPPFLAGLPLTEWGVGWRYDCDILAILSVYAYDMLLSVDLIED